MTNNVYIFGAGASKDFGLPLGVEIFDCAHGLSNLGEYSIETKALATVLADVDRYMLEIFTNLPKDKLRYPPLEEVLTFLWDCKNSETFDNQKQKLMSVFQHPAGARGVFEILTNMLALTLSGAMRLSRTKSYIHSFAEFIKSLFSERDTTVSFISLNYDVLLDNILVECMNNGIIDDYTYGIPLSDITERYRGASSQQLRHQTGVFLLKPHGSLNLVYCSHKQAPYGEGFYYSQADAIATTPDTLRCPGCGNAPKALLIPPLYNKSEYIAASAYKSRRFTWRSTPETYRKYCDSRIREVVGCANEITVIGYSLPAYDYDFKSLLMTSLMNNPNRAKVRLRLITKGDQTAVTNLLAQFERIVGSVTVEGRDGFYSYLTGS
jgi:hypothetical protein